MDWARREGWALHFAHPDIDTSTPASEMAANIIISARSTSGGWSANAAEMPWRPGGLEESVSKQGLALLIEITRRNVTERAAGQMFQAIADGLMADGIPTARGKSRWYPTTIKAVVASDTAAGLA